MKDETRNRRRDQILDIAIEVLTERGYRDTGMLEIARRASASKETLYAWFGDKRGLFEAAIRRNAETVQSVLAHHIGTSAPAEDALIEFGSALLGLLASDGAVAINRAAISEARSDPSLAQLLAEAGREATLPLFVRLLEDIRDREGLSIEDPAKAAEDFLGLLLGDMQTRRLLGVLQEPGSAEIRARAANATAAFLRLHAE